MINFGVLIYLNNYKKYSSINVGDYVQSLASINIYKKIVENQKNIKYDIKDFTNLVLDNKIEGYNFILIKRDNLFDIKNFKNYKNIITIFNGWWMWSFNNKDEICFKIPDNIIPIITSFHIYNNKLLEKNCIDEFRKYEPIGCRDLKTLEKLKSKNINAYFSGCLTLTIDFFKNNPIKNNIIINDKDKKVIPSLNLNGKKLTYIKHNINEIKYNYKLGFKKALELLEKYSKAEFVYTSRLHCYLPCLAMNVPVDFGSEDNKKKVWGSGKERFDGLRNLKNDKKEIERIKKNFKEKLNVIYDYIK